MESLQHDEFGHGSTGPDWYEVNGDERTGLSQASSFLRVSV